MRPGRPAAPFGPTRPRRARRCRRPRLGEPSKVTRTVRLLSTPRTATPPIAELRASVRVDTPELGDATACAEPLGRASVADRTFSEYRVPMPQSRQVSRHEVILLLRPSAARTAGRRSPDSRVSRACGSDIRRLFTYTPPDCTSRAPRSSTARAARAPRDRRSPMPSPSNASAGNLRRRHVVEHREHVVDAQRRDVFAEQHASTRARRAPPAPRRARAPSPRARARAAPRASPARVVVASRARRSPSRSRNVKNFRYAHDVAIVGVQPELIELERRRARGIEPDRARFGLAELRARRRRHAAASRARAPSAPRSLRIRSMPAVMLPH